MIFESANMDFTGVVVFLFSLMLGPPIILFIIGLAMFQKYRKAAKILFILGGVYLLIGLGICGSLLAS
ncbi:hypothetical protein SAMN02927921_02982 [Sinomicrobium oceani]|uniref:Uncharacterized protein n=1 Tax=Sinomicrobium oceani TaxID=1150368 RepID=A0A1K1QY71_9FLAO|nr:hypothetical protein [Sinomicrobium oceani]SFW64855.1 hypothetical protein SAMN02927921_02982 [Sinomicrobium oceani]